MSTYRPEFEVGLRMQAIPFEDIAAEMKRRYLAAGSPDVPRNAGNRRTPSKRALLAAIEELGGKW